MVSFSRFVANLMNSTQKFTLPEGLSSSDNRLRDNFINYDGSIKQPLYVQRDSFRLAILIVIVDFPYRLSWMWCGWCYNITRCFTKLWFLYLIY